MVCIYVFLLIIEVQFPLDYDTNMGAFRAAHKDTKGAHVLA